MTPLPARVRDHPSRHRYELEVDGHVAIAAYELEGGVISFVHTEVPKELGGRGIGSALASGALEDVRRRGLKVVARCPFIGAFLAKHPEYKDLVA
jgi:predicted GNAT family acetyltransferase